MKSILFTLVGLVVLVSVAPLRADEEEQALPEVELARSWRDQGEAAYRAKQWQNAIFLYRKWLEADPQDENTWYNLACCYRDGEGVEQSLEKALELFRKAADQDDADAQNQMGYFFEQGLGVERDIGLASEWYGKAAKQGHEDAKTALERIQNAESLPDP